MGISLEKTMQWDDVFIPYSSVFGQAGRVWITGVIHPFLGNQCPLCCLTLDSI